MTKQQIIDLANAKLRGQGNQVDLGSALPEIIAEILGLIPEDLPIASASKLGGVKIGSGVSVTEDGTISAQGGGGIPFERNSIVWDLLSMEFTEADVPVTIPDDLLEKFVGQPYVDINSTPMCTWDVDDSEVYDLIIDASPAMLGVDFANKTITMLSTGD